MGGIDYTKRTPPSRRQGASGGPAPVSPSKVTLTKAAPAVSLTKQGSAAGLLRVNLNWNATPLSGESRGSLRWLAGDGSRSAGIDLDLGCLYEFGDGTRGVVQALGNAFRSRSSFTHEPVIWLDGDDRSGTSSAGENLFFNLAYSAQIRRVLVFALIYSGVPNWAEASGVVTLFPVSGPQVEVCLDEHDPRSRLCAIAMLENVAGEIRVRREVRYIQGAQQELDRAYGWGMQWKPGRK
jgi:tellurite resistance protein TerA